MMVDYSTKETLPCTFFGRGGVFDRKPRFGRSTDNDLTPTVPALAISLSRPQALARAGALPSAYTGYDLGIQLLGGYLRMRLGKAIMISADQQLLGYVRKDI
jgi:hypothetical protein